MVLPGMASVAYPERRRGSVAPPLVHRISKKYRRNRKLGMKFGHTSYSKFGRRPFFCCFFDLLFGLYLKSGRKAVRNAGVDHFLVFT